MGILLAFFAGWAACARGGSASHEEVVAALRKVRDSQEVAELLQALRHHAGFALSELSSQLLADSGDGRPSTVPDLVARVRSMVVPPV